MAMLKDVARHAGVDVSTASKVLSGRAIRVADATRTRIESAARELNYTPNAVAQGLRLRRRGAVAMAVKNTTNYVFSEIVEGAEEAAERLGTSIYLVKQTEEADRLLSMIRQGRMDGWIFADDIPRTGFFDDLTKLDIPFVALNRYSAEPGPLVCLNDEAGFRLQAEHIAAAGHKRIAFVGVTPDSYLSRYCLQAWVREMARLGIRFNRTQLFSAKFSGEDAATVADQILRLKPQPTAVACSSLQAAGHLIDAFTARGVNVPNDISVVGYHDPHSVQPSRVAVTTVKMPSRAQGRLAVERLVDIIDGKLTDFSGELVSEPPEFVVRDSLLTLR